MGSLKDLCVTTRATPWPMQARPSGLKPPKETCVADRQSDRARTPALHVPFFRPSIGEAEIEEVSACLRSGWLTTGPRTRQFEAGFAAAVGAGHALAVNSCTAALHLAVEALGLQTRPGRARAHDDLRRHRRGRPLPRGGAAVGRLRPGDAQHGPGRRRGGRSPTSAPGARRSIRRLKSSASCPSTSAG